MTVHAIALEGRDVRLYGSLRKNRRETLDNSTLSGLKHAYTRARIMFERTGKRQFELERTYISDNIKLIQLCRGVI